MRVTSELGCQCSNIQHFPLITPSESNVTKTDKRWYPEYPCVKWKTLLPYDPRAGNMGKVWTFSRNEWKAGGLTVTLTGDWLGSVALLLGELHPNTPIIKHKVAALWLLCRGWCVRSGFLLVSLSKEKDLSASPIVPSPPQRFHRRVLKPRKIDTKKPKKKTPHTNKLNVQAPFNRELVPHGGAKRSESPQPSV